MRGGPRPLDNRKRTPPLWMDVCDMEKPVLEVERMVHYNLFGEALGSDPLPHFAESRDGDIDARFQPQKGMLC